MSEIPKNISKNANENGGETSSRLSETIFFLLCAWLVFSVIAFGAVDAWALGVCSLLAGLISVLWAADSYFEREFRFNASALQIPLLALILIGTIQLLPLRTLDLPKDLLAISMQNTLSLAPYQTRFAIVQLIIYLVFFAAALRFINSERRLRKIVTTIIIFGAAMAFFGILQSFANLDAIYGVRPFNQAIPFGSFVNRHHFAAFMEMLIGVALGLLLGKATKKNKRIFLIIAIVIMGMALVFTSSRGGMISLFAVVAFVVAANLLSKSESKTDETDGGDGKNFRSIFVLIGSAAALIAVLFGAVLLLGGDQSLIRGTGLESASDVSNGRFHFWQIAWRIFLDYPILGAGLDAFGAAFTRYDSWNGTFRVEQAHNDYLQILADAGICGFICVAAFVYLLFKQSVSTIGKSKDRFRRSAAIGALAGCLGVLIHSFFDFPLRTPSNAFFFLTLAVLATASIKEAKPSRRKRIKTAAKSQQI